MRKSDVEFHAEHYRPSHPAVNVKIYKSTRSIKLPMELGRSRKLDEKTYTVHYTHPEFTHDWLDENEERLQWTFGDACEQGFEYIREFATECFPASRFGKIEVYSEGRSGGWVVVHGLPDFETWDAVMLSRWARFARHARLTADDVPHQMVDMAYHNVFLPEHEDRIERDIEACEENPFTDARGVNPA